MCVCVQETIELTNSSITWKMTPQATNYFIWSVN